MSGSVDIDPKYRGVPSSRGGHEEPSLRNPDAFASAFIQTYVRSLAHIIALRQTVRSQRFDRQINETLTTVRTNFEKECGRIPMFPVILARKSFNGLAAYEHESPQTTNAVLEATRLILKQVYPTVEPDQLQKLLIKAIETHHNTETHPTTPNPTNLAALLNAASDSLPYLPKKERTVITLTNTVNKAITGIPNRPEKDSLTTQAETVRLKFVDIIVKDYTKGKQRIQEGNVLKAQLLHPGASLEQLAAITGYSDTVIERLLFQLRVHGPLSEDISDEDAIETIESTKAAALKRTGTRVERRRPPSYKERVVQFQTDHPKATFQDIRDYLGITQNALRTILREIEKDNET